MTIGLLGLQGAFLDHLRFLEQLDAHYHIVKSANDLKNVDRLIIPGGESTVMAKFLNQFEMIEPIQQAISGGMPVWGICAGAIILAETVDNHPGTLQVLPVSVQRNAYGRQWASSWKTIDLPGLTAAPFHAAFIRAPRIIARAPNVETLAYCGPDPVFVRFDRILATTFHPELTNDTIFHRYFLSL